MQNGNNKIHVFVSVILNIKPNAIMDGTVMKINE